MSLNNKLLSLINLLKGQTKYKSMKILSLIKDKNILNTIRHSENAIFVNDKVLLALNDGLTEKLMALFYGVELDLISTHFVKKASKLNFSVEPSLETRMALVCYKENGLVIFKSEENENELVAVCIYNEE